MMVAVGFSPRTRSKPKFTRRGATPDFTLPVHGRGTKGQGWVFIKTFSLCFRDGFTGWASVIHGSQRRRRGHGQRRLLRRPIISVFFTGTRNASPLKPSPIQRDGQMLVGLDAMLDGLGGLLAIHQRLPRIDVLGLVEVAVRDERKSLESDGVKMLFRFAISQASMIGAKTS